MCIVFIVINDNCCILVVVIVSDVFEIVGFSVVVNVIVWNCIVIIVGVICG